MRPAYSVIIFTAASGAGYGLLVWLALTALFHGPAANRWFAASGMLLALTLVTAGLLSSTFHLGRPERAWRAFSQWRSSWLSREGVLSVATLVTGLVFAIGWIFFGAFSGIIGLFGVLAAALAAGTIYCTGMIYASLKPIHQWHNRWVVPNYLALGVMAAFLL